MEPTALVEEQTFVSDVQTIPDTEGESVTPNEVLAEDDEVVGNEFIFQQVESLDNLFVENGREKPPKFINERYLLGSQMGEGSYGKVKQVLDTFTLQKMAVKIMNKQKLKKIPNGERNALNEFKIMRKLTHRNVVAVYDLLQREAEPILPQDGEVTLEEQSSSVLIGHRSVARKPEKLYLLMEYCLCGMYDLLQNAPDQKLPTWQAHKYFCDLMEGVEYLHSQRVIHKDIKPQNLLLSPDETLKITDFGVAEELDLYAKDASIKSSAGTPMFQPPEVASGKNSFCGFKLDVWCAGVTLYNFTTGHYPFEGHNLYILLENISKQPVHVPADLSPQLHSLLKFMLERNPRDRYSVAQVKSHR
ncbi:serine/threonine-protein kinase STK11-like [Convolutriloba macropyga]|uniref:serine/threonine-protein kinase STK11-like n=1 Tax=Convolutriloba macropyga TaxID=536237 RepID=UPI003F5258CC